MSSGNSLRTLSKLLRSKRSDSEQLVLFTAWLWGQYLPEAL